MGPGSWRICVMPFVRMPIVAVVASSLIFVLNLVNAMHNSPFRSGYLSRSIIDLVSGREESIEAVDKHLAILLRSSAALKKLPNPGHNDRSVNCVTLEFVQYIEERPVDFSPASEYGLDGVDV